MMIDKTYVTELMVGLRAKGNWQKDEMSANHIEKLSAE